MANKQFYNKIEEIKARKRELEKENRKFMAQCSHQTEKGKLRIKSIGHGKFRCDICGEEFSMDTFGLDDIHAATEILFDAAQQIRCLADPEDNEKLIRRLGAMAYDLKEMSKIYEKVVTSATKSGNGKKKKNKNKHNGNDESFGSYGGGVSFIRR